MVVFDTSTIVLALDPSAKPPTDENGQVVTNCKERVEHLLDTLNTSKTTILIPTPVLAEFLVGVGSNKNDYIDKISKSKNFNWGSFDVKAAIELSLLKDPDLQSNKKLDAITTKAKIKFDRQVIAIAKSRGAERIYTDDNGLAECARKNGIAAVMTWELPVPQKAAQIELNLPRPENENQGK